MVQIKIKGVNSEYHVMAEFDDTTAFLKELTARLLRCTANGTSALEAFFHLPNMKDEDFLAVLAVCQNCHVIMKGCNWHPSKPEIKVVQKTLRNGSRTRFQEPTLLLGSIEQQAYVTASVSLYVLGDVAGSIDLLYEDCELYASSLQGNVRICDSCYQNLTSFSPTRVYYEHCVVKQEQLKEERMWEKQSQ